MKNWINTGEITPSKNKHTLFRKKFKIENKCGKYSLNITADDYYKLYVNGIFLGQGPASSYNYAYNYNVYDISEYLTEGENLIAVHTYYQGFVNWGWTSGDCRHGLYAELFADEKPVLITDETWKCTEALHFNKEVSVTGYDTQFLENIDMRFYEYGWETIDYNHSAWRNAVINKNDDHTAVMQITPAVQCYTVTPTSIKYIDKNSFLLDFGKEITAGLKLVAQGENGSQIRLRFGEELNGDGSVRYEMRCNVVYEEFWSLSGRADIAENYDYKGFRYVEIKTDDKNVKPECFFAVVRHYPVKNKAEISINDEKYRQIWDICENAVIIGSQEGFLDCPTREKGQYLGDMTVTALSHAYITGDTRLYKKALVDFAQSIKLYDGMSAVAPSTRDHHIADFSLFYPMQLLNYYHLTGDTDFLKKMLFAAENVMNYFEKYIREDGLLESVTGKWNLVDWPENLRDNYDFELAQPVVANGCHNVINAHYYGAMKCMNEILQISGKNTEYDLAKFKNAFMQEFYNKETGLFTDSKVSDHSSQHSNTLPLFHEMLTYEEAEPLLNKIEERGFCCGVFFSYFVLKALTKYGRYEQAYRLIISEGERTWMNMVHEGATSCFEAWGKEQKWNTSLCHPWASTPVIMLVEDFAGVKYENGEIRMNPQNIGGLSGILNLYHKGENIKINF